MKYRAIALLVSTAVAVILTAAQTRPRRPAPRPATQQAPRGSANRYSAFLHSSAKHQSLTCGECHKVPTEWTAKRTFPDVADFPNHDACVRCHRQQFFTRQAFVAAGPVICTVCHVRAAPREDGRFAFGKPNNANQPVKAREERQFSIEFPHDKHQNVIASTNPLDQERRPGFIVRASFSLYQDKKPVYHNCSICHITNTTFIHVPAPRSPDVFEPPIGTFKSTPQGHDLCFNCHWREQKPAADDCGGCHKPSQAFVPGLWPKRISAKFSHEGGQGEHVQECTTCHINITRRSTLVGMTPDVPITVCATCHKDNKKTTYPKLKTIEEEFQQYPKTGNCVYCHTVDVSKKKPPASHEAVNK